MASRLERRRGEHHSQTNKRIDRTKGASDASQIEYSSNWAGAVWDSYPSGTFKSVTGTFTAPDPSGSPGAAAIWVGIDGDTCESAILQTGIDAIISNGAVSYAAWYEWYPAVSSDFSGITISSGDVITLAVNASSTTAGTVVITNESNGQTVSKSLTSSTPLCQQNAEWIVEDFEQGFELVPFANFGTVTFSSASAITQSGTSIGPSGATTFDIMQGREILTSVSISSSGLTISYTG
ncbi:hypothetical protein H0H92_008150 [Tricholoma furcatifolium]|nr:hypothetical protein H0H92_008150 [Tricholoma furcatifolium]